MAVVKYKADYFLKDFTTLREELITRAPLISEGRLTDLNESSVTVTLIELFAAMGDMLSFYLDSNALETFLPTVRQPENVYRHGHLIGYTIREMTSAKAYVQFSIPTARTAPGNEVFIPKGTRLGTSTGDAGQFITQENTSIPIGHTVSELILAVQGQVYSENFVSDGTASQFSELSATNIDPDTIEVYTGATKWSAQESFLYSEDTDYDFVLDTNYLGVTRVLFGDGKYGRAPSVGEAITVNYLVSDGDAGNVGADAINLIFSEVTTINGNSVEGLTVTNPDAAAGGSPRQSLEHVKRNAPGSLAALYRPLTKYDYISLIERLGGIQHVNVWGEQEENPPDYVNMNWANICLVPVGGGLPSQNLKSTTQEYLLELQPITVRLRFIDPEYIKTQAGMDVYVEAGYSQEDIRIQITDEVRSFFELENVTFGQDIRASILYKIAMSYAGVSHCFVDDFDTLADDGNTYQGVVGSEYLVPTPDVDGTVTSFTGTFIRRDIVPSSISIDTNVEVNSEEITVTDDGAGHLTGYAGSSLEASGTIDYATGAWALVFTTAVPPEATRFEGAYEYYVRGQEIIFQKWQLPTLDLFDIRMHLARELPIPDLYPNESTE